ncbi:hypothetical protein AB0L13_23540 [Saccharopolyspora shandongensis]|uniref:hypothetical protein n=1 Tax=Saccharopolyspora shandongensis TaxID=418495 RepID=UPI003447F1B7
MTDSGAGTGPPDVDGGPGDVDAAVRALAQADPHSFYDAAQRFDRTAGRLRTVSERFRGRLRHLEQVWQGPGYEMFAKSADQLVNRIEQVVGVLAEPSYAGLLNELGDALAEAKREVEDARSQAAGDPGIRAEQDSRAQEVLRRLSNTYGSVGRRFRAPPVRQARVPGGSVRVSSADFHGSSGGGRTASDDFAASGSGGGTPLTESGRISAGDTDGSGTALGRGASTDELSAVEEPGEGSAGSIWSSVLPTAALPAAAVLGRKQRKRSEKKQDQQARDRDEFDESGDSTQERDEKSRVSDYRKENSEQDSGRKEGQRESGIDQQEDDGSERNTGQDHRTLRSQSTSDDVGVQEESPSERDSRQPLAAAAPPGADAAVAQPPAVQPSFTQPSASQGSPVHSAAPGAATGLRASSFLPGSATAPPPPPPTGLRSDGSSLTAPVETGSGPTGQPGTGSATQGTGGPQGGMPPMNPRTMGGPGQKEQQESGHQERERNVAEHEDPSTWQVGAGSAGALGRAHPERGKENPR